MYIYIHMYYIYMYTHIFIYVYIYTYIYSCSPFLLSSVSHMSPTNRTHLEVETWLSSENEIEWHGVAAMRRSPKNSCLFCNRTRQKYGSFSDEMLHLGRLLTAAHCNTQRQGMSVVPCAHRNTLQHTATQRTTLQHTIAHSKSTLQHTQVSACAAAMYACATQCKTLQHTTTHCTTLQHAITKCNILPLKRLPRLL